MNTSLKWAIIQYLKKKKKPKNKSNTQPQQTEKSQIISIQIKSYWILPSLIFLDEPLKIVHLGCWTEAEVLSSGNISERQEEAGCELLAVFENYLCKPVGLGWLPGLEPAYLLSQRA